MIIWSNFRNFSSAEKAGIKATTSPDSYDIPEPEKPPKVGRLSINLAEMIVIQLPIDCG